MSPTAECDECSNASARRIACSNLHVSQRHNGGRYVLEDMISTNTQHDFLLLGLVNSPLNATNSKVDGVASHSYMKIR